MLLLFYSFLCDFSNEIFLNQVLSTTSYRNTCIIKNCRAALVLSVPSPSLPSLQPKSLPCTNKQFSKRKIISGPYLNVLVLLVMYYHLTTQWCCFHTDFFLADKHPIQDAGSNIHSLLLHNWRVYKYIYIYTCIYIIWYPWGQLSVSNNLRNSTNWYYLAFFFFFIKCITVNLETYWVTPLNYFPLLRLFQYLNRILYVFLLLNETIVIHNLFNMKNCPPKWILI